MNKVILIGNLARDPELRTTASGVSVCNFTIAVNRRFANQQGVREADFINCVAWRQQGEFVSKYFQKGKKIGIVGALQVRSYEAQDGQKRYVTEVMVDEAEFVERKDGSSGGYSEGSGFKPDPAPPADTDMGFTEVDDDDLPF